MGHFGFSYVGLAFLLLLFLPNLAWAYAKPQGYSTEGESRFLRVLERAGEAACTVTVLIFEDFNPRPWTPWTLWLVAAVLLMGLYELWWLRYFLSEKRLEDFYGSFLGVPVAGASLPVAAFLLLGIYGRVVWLILSALALGVGHIGIHMGHRRDLAKGKEKSR